MLNLNIKKVVLISFLMISILFIYYYFKKNNNVRKEKDKEIKELKQLVSIMKLQYEHLNPIKNVAI